MKDIKRKNDEGWTWYEYGELLDSFELEQVIEECCGYYQGDYVCLFRDGNRYGFLVFGYGSCSGCDALEGACGESYEAVVALRDSLFESIRWGTAEETLAYLESGEGKDWFWYDDEIKEAIAKAIEYISTK
jgi:hypothetical protein